MMWNNEKFNPLNISVFIAILFHFSGCIGMFTSFRPWFISMTPLTLLLMTVLIFWNEKKWDKTLWIYFGLCTAVGFVSEVIGTNTSYLFGMYSYGSAMGIKVASVPLLIGLLWFVTIYCVANTVLFFYQKYISTDRSLAINAGLIIFAAGLTTLFDYILEPSAISLGYWQWYPDGSVPIFNYVCWFFISGFLFCPYFLIDRLNRDLNYFSIFLLFIQAVFFVVVR